MRKNQPARSLAVIGALSFIFICGLVLFVGRPGAGPFPESFLYRLAAWQTLLAGVVAALGAFAAIVAVILQVNDRRTADIERRQQEHYAIAAILTAELDSFTRDVGASLVTWFEHLREHPGRKSPPPFLPPGMPVTTRLLDRLGGLDRSIVDAVIELYMYREENARVLADRNLNSHETFEHTMLTMHAMGLHALKATSAVIGQLERATEHEVVAKQFYPLSATDPSASPAP